MDALDLGGYERILRAFPLRTGVPGPEWMIIGPESDTRGFGGVVAAGWVRFYDPARCLVTFLVDFGTELRS
jgi:hypothetical protein